MLRIKFNARTRTASFNGRRGFNNWGIPVKGVERIRFTGNVCSYIVHRKYLMSSTTVRQVLCNAKTGLHNLATTWEAKGRIVPI